MEIQSEIIEILRERKLTETTVESCTGGMITVSTRWLSILAPLALLTSSTIVSFSPAIIQADTPITAAHRKRTM